METHGSATRGWLEWAISAAWGRLFPSVPHVWQLVHLHGITWLGSCGLSACSSRSTALSSASRCPASGSWALLGELCCLSGIPPLSTGLGPRFLLEDITNLLSKQMVCSSDTQSILSWVPPKRDPKQRNPLQSNFPSPYVTVLTHSNIRVLVYSILH